MATLIIRAVGFHPDRGTIHATGISINETQAEVRERQKAVRHSLFAQGANRLYDLTIVPVEKSSDGFGIRFSAQAGGRHRSSNATRHEDALIDAAFEARTATPRE